jgi:hypothetical protein
MYVPVTTQFYSQRSKRTNAVFNTIYYTSLHVYSSVGTGRCIDLRCR